MAEITTFFNDVICACEGKGSILGPGLVQHRSVQPLFFFLFFFFFFKVFRMFSR